MIYAGYHVCTTIGRGPQIDVDVIGKPNSTICLCFLIFFNHDFLLLIFSVSFLLLFCFLYVVMHYLVQVILNNASNCELQYVYGCNAVPMADKKNPHIGVVVKMSSSGLKYNCSLAVSVLCNLNGVQVRFSFFL